MFPYWEQRTAHPSPIPIRYNATVDLASLLNPEQLAAATHTGGPLLVFAGAGSGKTRVIVHRIAHQVLNQGVRASEILAVTFTNKAAGEMRARLEQLLGPEAKYCWVSTFHALSARLLRREALNVPALGLTRDFAIYDESDQLALMKRVLAELNIAADPKSSLSRIDRWQNDGISPDDVRINDWDVPGKIAKRAYAAYDQALRRANAIDFGGLLVRVLELFQRAPEAGARYAERFKQILVDEFQDTNGVQYELVRQLAKGGAEICAVGDDDQSIYRWRGAEVKNILSFERDFPGARVVKLEQNYRSTGFILKAANAVIACNTERAEKKLWTALGDGLRPRLLVASDERDEAQQVSRMINAAHDRGTRFGDTAVFYRTNAMSRVLEDALRARGVPYQIVRGRSFYDRAEVKNVAAYLRLALNPRSDADLARVINVPARGIGDTTVERLAASARERGVALWDSLGDVPDANAGARAKLAAFRALIEELQAVAATASATDAVEAVMKLTGYAAKLAEDDDGEDRLENLGELLNAAKEFDAAWSGTSQGAVRPALAAAIANAQLDRADNAALPNAPALLPLAGFLELLALASDADGETGGDRVSLMTLHAAKGLEFDQVFLCGMEERVFPHARSLSQDESGEDLQAIAEERRLCYVGLTRARRRLVLTLARSRSLFGELKFNPPSRFLRDVPPELLEGVEALSERAPSWSRPQPSYAAPRGERVEYDDGYTARKPQPLRAPPAVGLPPHGTRVRHAQFGSGRVEGASGDKLTVRFDSVGVKTVLARFVAPG